MVVVLANEKCNVPAIFCENYWKSYKSTFVTFDLVTLKSLDLCLAFFLCTLSFRSGLSSPDKCRLRSMFFSQKDRSDGKFFSASQYSVYSYNCLQDAVLVVLACNQSLRRLRHEILCFWHGYNQFKVVSTQTPTRSLITTLRLALLCKFSGTVLHPFSILCTLCFIICFYLERNCTMVAIHCSKFLGSWVTIFNSQILVRSEQIF